MKLIIAGSRTFNDYEQLRHRCNLIIEYAASEEEIEIVSGTAPGADRLGEKYAKEKGYAIKQFPADWKKLGRRAGIVRNTEMAQYADALIAFWDGKSKGTMHMINLMNAKSKLVWVF